MPIRKINSFPDPVARDAVGRMKRTLTVISPTAIPAGIKGVLQHEAVAKTKKPRPVGQGPFKTPERCAAFS